MKKILITIFLISYQLVLSQRNDILDRKNVFTLEVFGHSDSFLAVNYERLFLSGNEKLIYSFRTGVGRKPGYDFHGEYFKGVTTVPFVFSVLYGKKHFAQLGLGYSALFSQNFVYSSSEVYKEFESDFSISIGYRFMTKDGIVAQAYPVFILKDNPVTKSMLSFGVSLGYSF
ncbi:hypothetical protein RF683_04895 [Flavobacterium sp. 20NA77.7]|uniref:DUF3575 domain-containing protein n=1 Tax=Flavobacterium nakdongensis TaxID=3073563 RepID=A0ABY9RC18_9FLAO|nr:hypothetical protein [Flavobacterium sp. 20NA77.7]WMW78783.1 hypothetical protein RF683_04895 [Flavobacterium sp. 20NA77.7]